MSWSIVKIALAMGMPPGMVPGNELLPLGVSEYLYFFAGLALAVPLAVARFGRAAAAGEDRNRYLFLAVLASALFLLSLRSARATEYAIPAATLLLGYWWRDEPARRFAAAALLAMAAVQLPSSLRYVQDSWTLPQGGNTSWYFNALDRLPPEADGGKLFTCEWQSGSYVLYARPRIRFVDLLDPALLWQADPRRYLLRDALANGQLREPWRALREGFDADFVLCASGLTEQMAADPAHFEELRGEAPSGPLRVFRVLPEATP
jgi:hypothetical protein